MTIYEYRCRSCGRTREETRPDLASECQCGGLSARDYHSVSIRRATAFQRHFNPAVGRVVRTEAEFRSELRRAADANSLATGTDHQYEPIDTTDIPPSNDDMKILDEKARVLSSRGQLPSKVSYFA